MAETKNLCAQIDLALHTKVCEEREKAGQTTSQYITQLLMEYYEMKENGGKSSMENKGNRTMAFQISEELFQRIKRYLERESKHLGRKYTQREFVLDLITEALWNPPRGRGGPGTDTGREHPRRGGIRTGKARV